MKKKQQENLILTTTFAEQTPLNKMQASKDDKLNLV